LPRKLGVKVQVAPEADQFIGELAGKVLKGMEDVWVNGHGLTAAAARVNDYSQRESSIISP
jgi:hypothetical protein